MKPKGSGRPGQDPEIPDWTFLTNHAHVLICLARDTNLVLRDVARLVGITERAVQRIVADLEAEGYLERTREGRQNTYRLTLTKKLRHPVERNCHIRAFVDLIK